MSAAEFQVMPRLTADEYAELEASIVEHGVQVPIVLSRDDRIVDGYHRDEIARKHSLHCPRVYADGDETELRGLAFSLNLHRRHLNREQKRELVAESIKADPQLSDREHGRRTGVSAQTATKVRDELEKSAQVEHFSERIDPRTGNASQPAYVTIAGRDDQVYIVAFDMADLGYLKRAAEYAQSVENRESSSEDLARVTPTGMPFLLELAKDEFGGGAA